MSYSRWEKEIERFNLTYYEINFILLEVLGRTYESVKLNGLSKEELERILPFMKQAQTTPVEYIFKKAFFRNLELYVDERVLIPRNETEQIVDIALEIIRKENKKKILEVGTGSGAIALSLSLEGNLTLFANDISMDAIEVARFNRDSLNLSQQVLLFVSDGLEGTRGGWDMIIWNFPYVLPHEYPHLPDKVKVEPKVALVSTPEKLIRFVRDALHHIKEGGYIIMELSPQLIRTLERHYPQLLVEKDLYGIERFAVLKKD